MGPQFDHCGNLTKEAEKYGLITELQWGRSSITAEIVG